jgi:type VII secretion integral membrane protein EccD
VCGIGVLPLLAIRLGRLPMPPPTLPIGVGADDLRVAGGGSLAAARERPDRTRVFTAVDRAEEVLTGMLVGHALLCLAGGLVLVVAGGSAGLLLVAVGGVALLLRSRLFVSVRQRLPLMMAGTGLLVTLALDLLLGASDRGLLGVVIAAVLLSLVMVAAGATYSHRSPSPYLVRAADMVDTILVISVIPVACAVLGLYGRVRGLG